MSDNGPSRHTVLKYRADILCLCDHSDFVVRVTGVLTLSNILGLRPQPIIAWLYTLRHFIEFEPAFNCFCPRHQLRLYTAYGCNTSDRCFLRDMPNLHAQGTVFVLTDNIRPTDSLLD